jgi:hypothetical protein
MNYFVSTRSGRIWLLVITLTGFLLSITSLFWISRGGAISQVNRNNAASKLLEVYLPLLSLICAFLFGTKNTRKKMHTSVEAFLFAVTVTFLYSFAPAFFLWFGEYIEDIVDLLMKAKPFGDVLVLAAIGFYFSKSEGD